MAVRDRSTAELVCHAHGVNIMFPPPLQNVARLHAVRSHQNQTAIATYNLGQLCASTAFQNYLFVSILVFFLAACYDHARLHVMNQRIRTTCRCQQPQPSREN